ncbi:MULTISPECIES: hypothetical protein [unclassified Beijerinckia]|uniref:hypothetical protein n=1 Tax=unclassified Beijerinckia TaxID=2638183 RepID=UPI00089599EB|nr:MULTISPECIES: hypothetical protein [unclassified Beijerinckia]MDH7795809.1 hypothetical protein [Beijerinckia sp. GAS462]SEC17312.1 hypothetical protein SAMN05443249_2087 [Beijerinckia sp. 28-YEA-48]
MKRVYVTDMYEFEIDSQRIQYSIHPRALKAFGATDDIPEDDLFDMIDERRDEFNEAAKAKYLAMGRPTTMVMLDFDDFDTKTELDDPV